MEKKDQQSKTHNQPEKRSGQQPQKQNPTPSKNPTNKPGQK